jgi:DNA polymerase-3 subunit gamma/tau
LIVAAFFLPRACHSHWVSFETGFMAYEVLARKYRSRTFDEIVGQKAIATTLKNAVESGRIHHGYLFTGTRGVGKTSMARILAKALNCFAFDAPTTTPCCACELCRRVSEGGDLDVVEIDAASNTGVDNIRELRSNAAYKPARARFKVYIIDEVHMLSTGAFNALLKTLEEPPEHVKFVLATTEAHKVPATIKSRCQRFDFRSISPADIGEQLQRILAAEEITADEVVIRRVARQAQGSMRDALSLLDQLLAYGTRELTEDLIEDLLPTAHNVVIARLVDALAEQDAGAALACVEESLGAGETAARFCDLLVEHLRSLMLLSVCGVDTDMVDVGSGVREQLAAQVPRFDPPTYVYMIGLLEEVRRQVKASSAPRALVDAAVVRLAYASSFSQIETVLARIDGTEPAGAATTSAGATRRAAAPAGAAGSKKKSDPRVGASGRGAAAAAGPPRRPPAGDAKSAPQRPAATREPATGRPRGERPANVSAEERNRLMADPVVRKAVELAGGSIIDVIKRQQAGVAEAGGEAEPATLDGADAD